MNNPNSGYQQVFPARAGVILRKTPENTEVMRFPRTRGGDPSVGVIGIPPSVFSPHARG